MSNWKVMCSLTVKGHGTYKVKMFETLGDFISFARDEWAKFWSNPEPKKHLIIKATHRITHDVKNISFDSGGFMKIK